MKKLPIVFLCAMLISSVAAAAPFTDYSQGKTAVEVDVYPNLKTHFTNSHNYDAVPRVQAGQFAFGITTGINHHFAVQYRQFNPRTKVFSNQDQYLETIKISTQECNVLYKLNNNVSVFAGDCWTMAEDFSPVYSRSDRKNMLQVGLSGQCPLTDKTFLYGTVGVGRELTNYEIGAGYKLTPKLELDINYRELIEKDYSAARADTTFRGFGYGVTCKF